MGTRKTFVRVMDSLIQDFCMGGKGKVFKGKVFKIIARFPSPMIYDKMSLL
jgi:hypothetical protein